MGNSQPLPAVVLVVLATIILFASCEAVSLKLRSIKQHRTTRYNHLDSLVTELDQNYVPRTSDPRHNGEKMNVRRNLNEKVDTKDKPYHKYAKKIAITIGATAPKLISVNSFLQSQTVPQTAQLKFKSPRNRYVMIKNSLGGDVDRVIGFIRKSDAEKIARRVHGMNRENRMGFRTDFSGAVRSGRMFLNRRM